LELPKHGFFFSGYCKREAGSLCGLGCLTGYRLVNGDSFRECRQDGTWSGHQPKCEGKIISLLRYQNTFIFVFRNSLSFFESSCSSNTRMFTSTKQY
jgi:hypothetical protein